MTGGLILVVEDNPRNLRLVRDVLCYDGYEVIEASNAEDGVALTRQRRPDLVLMDIQLPGMDGMEAMLTLKSNEETVGVPVVAVTSFAMKNDRERAIEAGFDGYLAKPISIHELRDEVRKFVHSQEDGVD